MVGIKLIYDELKYSIDFVLKYHNQYKLLKWYCIIKAIKYLSFISLWYITQFLYKNYGLEDIKYNIISVWYWCNINLGNYRIHIGFYVIKYIQGCHALISSFQIIENLRETQENFNFLKLWETQSSFDFF